jgi:hypothetical protein
MGGEAIGRRGVEGKVKETTVLLLRDDERSLSWSFVNEKMRGEGKRELETGPIATRLNISTPRRPDLHKNEARKRNIRSR